MTTKKKVSKKVVTKKKKHRPARKVLSRKEVVKGHPSSFNDALKETMLKLFKDGKSNKQVAEYIGVSIRTLYNWMAKDKTFMQSLKKSKSIANDLVEATLFQRATGYSHKEEKVFCSEGQVVTHETTKHYPPDPTSMIFWLKNREPDRWKDRQPDDKDNLNITVTLADKLSKARLRVDKK